MSSTETQPTGATRRGRTRSRAPFVGLIDAGQRESAERQVYRILRREIMAGSLPPGSMLTSRGLAEAFAISPTPIREALKRLEADGALHSRRNSAFYLTTLTRADYQEILQIRLRLEGLALRWAAELIGEPALRRAERLNDKLEHESHNPRIMLSLNFGFHFELYRAAKRANLLTLLENLWLRIGPLLHYSSAGYDGVAVAKTHREILAALRARDGDRAEQALARDLIEAADLIIPQLDA